MRKKGPQPHRVGTWATFSVLDQMKVNGSGYKEVFQLLKFLVL